MSDEYSQPTLELSRTFEGWWLPRRPLCCDDDYARLRRRSRAAALRCKHIESNPAALVNTIVVDIDDSEARAVALWEHEGMRPNFLAENPANGHAHAGWVLTYPVPRTDMPPKSWKRTKRARTQGVGRNCTVFDKARHKAYSFVRTLPDRSPASNEALRLYVRQVCHEINITEFAADPLPTREVEDIAKSIHKWTVTRFDGWRDGAVVCQANFITIQSCRGKKSGNARLNKRMEMLTRYEQEVLGKCR